MGMAWCKNVSGFKPTVPRASKHMHAGVRGLSNCGLSCCINALLQTFAATTELQELLSRWQPSEASDKNVPLELKTALEAMMDKSQASPHLDFLKCLHENNICRNTQHDADEVFHTILNLIQKQMTDQQTAAEIQNLYQMKMEVCTQCLQCQNVHRIPNIFLSLPLHLHEFESTLKDCFKMFFEPQKLGDSEAFYCGNCERKMPSTQWYNLVSLPSILCINLKRLRCTRGFTRKMNTKVSFPEMINVAEMLPEKHSRMTESRYRLYGVVVHAGWAMMGHYTAYIYSTDCKWYYVDDSRMHQVCWEEVQNTYGGRRQSSETAYMLMYRTLSSEAAQKSAS